MCDTIAVHGSLTGNGKNILMKNSDRPLGECQPLVFIPGETGRYAVLGSRPYWIHGFEMGANEKGLFIGNEAEGSRCPAETEEGMLGMDMLRYALEHAASCREAIRVLAALLCEHGQNANASRLFDRRYENSYILCDKTEIWVMETAGREWAAREIRDYAAVSNCYTIETEYDLCSEDMEKLVREKRWQHPSEPISFAKAYTLPASRQRNALPRRRRMVKLMTDILEREGKAGFSNLSVIFRDHSQDEVNAPRFGNMTGNNVSVCMHACSWEEAQTAASMYMSYAAEEEILRFLWAPGTPCASLYLPVGWIPGEELHLPESLSSGGEYYSEESLWWTSERLSSLISIDEERFGETAKKKLSLLEKDILSREGERITSAKSLIANGDASGAQQILNQFTEECVGETINLMRELTAEIMDEIKASGGLFGPKKEFLEAYANRTAMPLP